MEKYKCTANALNVREAPTITGNVIGHLKKNNVVELISKSGDGYWYKVIKGELEGWASHKYLKLVVEATPENHPWMPIALAEEGVKEFTGNGDNPRIVEYLRSTNLSTQHSSNDETPWCSAFANWCMERAGFEGTDSAAARSWLNWGKKIETPERGCIVVFSRPPNAWSGHVAFYVGKTATHIKVLGGNQSDAVNVSSYAKGRLLGYRLPG